MNDELKKKPLAEAIAEAVGSELSLSLARECEAFEIDFAYLKKYVKPDNFIISSYFQRKGKLNLEKSWTGMYREGILVLGWQKHLMGGVYSRSYYLIVNREHLPFSCEPGAPNDPQRMAYFVKRTLQ